MIQKSRRKCQVGPCSCCKTGDFATRGSHAPPTEPESAIQRRILDMLHAVGIMAWRTNSGSAAHNFKGAPIGTADIIGIANDGTGRFLAIEVKTPSKTSKLNPAQIEWHNRITAHGGLCGVARSTDDARALLQLWGLI